MRSPNRAGMSPPTVRPAWKQVQNMVRSAIEQYKVCVAFWTGKIWSYEQKSD